MTNPQIDALLFLHASVDGDAEAPLDAPAASTLAELRALGLVDDDQLTTDGLAALQQRCEARARHAAALPYGSVTVTDGPHAGEAGYHDDTHSVVRNLDPERLWGYDPGERAIVYLFSRGAPFDSAPVYVPPHHLRAEAHMELEHWVQTNPVLAASVGVPSLSGVEQHVSEEAREALRERLEAWTSDQLGPPRR
ncbi:MAG: hypothetical protein H6739_06525 [Alphaproteobacteria bacterium]|nr:hypothetical protein [Alphaproteobacteria bacterium]